MGTISHENYTFSLGFSRADASSPDTTRDVVLYGAHVPISGRTDSRVAAPYQEKRTLPGTHASVSEFVCVAALGAEAPISVSRFGNINPIPFRTTGATRASPRFRTAFAYPLGSTDPCSTAVHMEPFSTSAFKICTDGCSTRARALGFYARRRGPPTRRRIAHRYVLVLRRRPGIGPTLQRHPFSGLIDSAESLRSSTRVSSGFNLFRHSSPSFGSRHALRTVPGRPTPRSARAPGHPKAPDAAISPRPDGGSYDRAPIALARRRVTLRAAF
ncbi:unnamed protein product [Clavelina lepadiformis]|uniref:Uncharacterized protein n=1 Tax=Clavelina lepadiformis TaxID=159417 RepID=A0ABP0GDV7_CLALP